MEGFNFDNTVEHRVEKSDYEKLVEDAPGKAQTLISKIEGFTGMEIHEQIDALNALFKTLEEGGNENRYIAREVSRMCGEIERKKQFAENDAKYAVAA